MTEIFFFSCLQESIDHPLKERVTSSNLSPKSSIARAIAQLGKHIRLQGLRHYDESMSFEQIWDIITSNPIDSIAVAVAGLAAAFAFFQTRSAKQAMSLSVFTAALEQIADPDTRKLRKYI